MTTVKEIKSVRNACTLLEAVAERQPVGVSDLARATAIDKSAAHRLAVTLHGAGWLDKGSDGRWRLAPRLVRLAAGAGGRSLATAMRPVLEHLRDETGETVILVAVDHDRLLVLDVAESRHALRVSPPGPYLPLRQSSAVRAVAAYLPHDDVEALRDIDATLDERTLEEVRRRGWAINDGEIVSDTRVVGTAVRGGDGLPLAAVIIAAPTSRMSLADMHRIGAELAATVHATALG